MPKKLLIYPDKCVGCRICESFCSLSHTGSCNPTRSRVNVIKFILDVHCIPMMCQQCEVPACEKTCPSCAIYRNRATGAMETDRDRCLVCRMCVAVCPFGGTGVDPVAGAIIRCDLCGGAPVCAEMCPQGAIVYLEEERQGLHKKRASAATIMTALEAGTREPAAPKRAGQEQAASR